ncbi:hypothetical protein B0A48_11951 [Cryoendolithus antarcticus]|uniref:Uncharacterized protein n=1 Tax=Cryoendolithus antarcticus TaxID=1507870 RepID=A0A1V8STQ1_9PEZI|nr:hypothetical protein B0A48_11951 [Cryoendolithus antarcticus]
MSPTTSKDVTIPNCVPKTRNSGAAYLHAQRLLHPDILAHSLRVYIYARALIKVDISHVNELQPTASFGSQLFPDLSAEFTDLDDLIFAAAIFHDFGTCTDHDHAQRFEVCGADAAVQFLSSASFDVDLREIWTAIALHTSRGIAERMGPLTRCLRMGVKADFGDGKWRALLGEGVVERTEREFPRGEIEKVLGNAVAEQGVRVPLKAPRGSWPGDLLRARLDEPEWEGINKGF